MRVVLLFIALVGLFRPVTMRRCRLGLYADDCGVDPECREKSICRSLPGVFWFPDRRSLMSTTSIVSSKRKASAPHSQFRPTSRTPPCRPCSTVPIRVAFNLDRAADRSNVRSSPSTISSKLFSCSSTRHARRRGRSRASRVKPSCSPPRTRIVSPIAALAVMQQIASRIRDSHFRGKKRHFQASFLSSLSDFSSSEKLGRRLTGMFWRPTSIQIVGRMVVEVRNKNFADQVIEMLILLDHVLDLG